MRPFGFDAAEKKMLNAGGITKDEAMSNEPKRVSAAPLPEAITASVALRAAVVANAMMILGALLRPDAQGLLDSLNLFIAAASYGEMALLGTLGGLFLIWPNVGRFGKIGAALGLSGIFSMIFFAALSPEQVPAWGLLRVGLTGGLIAAGVLLYFDWRQKTLSPALSEAKLQALQSRIRPHFFFNAINGIAMLASKSPDKAEEALLDLADVFRALMREQASLGTLRSEMDLTRKYLSIEQMRFGERLRVSISVDEQALGAEIPNLLIQPLAENAVIHGIEPIGEGEISIRAFIFEGRLHIVLENPFAAPVRGEQAPRKGNNMALENIRQRLALLYPDEASIATQGKGSVWRAHLKLPLRLPAAAARAAGKGNKPASAQAAGNSGRKR